jgi:uncharacterized protein (TIGR03083 family)
LTNASPPKAMTNWTDLYREARKRIAALMREASAEQRTRIVPACPDWTVSDTVVHLAANAADLLTGRLQGVPTEEQTAAQIDQRRGQPLEEVLTEWDIAAGPIERKLAAGKLTLALVQDVLVHEADIRGALGAGRLPEEAWTSSLELGIGRAAERMGHLGELRIFAGKHHFIVGSGEPVTTVEVDPYELWRAMPGRRSRAQMAAWNWSGDPQPYLQALPIFGPTRVALTEPEVG